MASRFQSISNDDVNDFLSSEKNKNTLRKTKSDIATLNLFLKSKGETRDINHIPPRELNDIICMFLLSVRRKDGSEYEPSSLRGMITSIDRHLKENYYPTTITNGDEFYKTRSVLTTKQKSLKKQGKGNKPNAASPLNDEQVELLWENGQFGSSKPESILNTLWFYNTAGFGLRGVDEHRQMTYGDVSLKTDADGLDYLEFSERSTKTRQGGDTTNLRQVKPKIWENTSNKGRCPVSVFKKYMQLRPADYCNENDPFYIASNPRSTSENFKPATDYWFKKQPIGVNKLGTFMKRMSATLPGCDAKKLSNHSARKYLIQKLVDNEVPPTDIIQISGHKNVNSVNAYSHINEKKHKRISAMITNNELKDKSEPEQKKMKTPQTEVQNNPPNPNFDLGFSIEDIPDLQNNNPTRSQSLSQINHLNGIIPSAQNMYSPIFHINVINNYTSK